MKHVNDKIVVITGTASGIGRALALAFGERKARLALNDFDTKGLEETIDLLKKMGTNELLPAIFDVSNN